VRKYAEEGCFGGGGDATEGTVTIEDARMLMDGRSGALPWSATFAGPRAIACVGGCDINAYCGEVCRDEAWKEHEAFLCLGSSGRARDKRALAEFYAHAGETNDIFTLAAKAVVHMCSRSMDAEAKAATAIGRDQTLHGGGGKSTVSVDSALDELRAIEDYARLPYAAVANAPWWECVATPEDCEDEEAELEFRKTLRTLANDSLELLRLALSDLASAYPRFFELETYGRLIGAFELNNLELVVESPVENYFLAIDAAPEGEEKRAAMRVTQPLLDALDTDYDIPCLGTALFSVQSGFNHDCDPNAQPLKGEEDVTGACVIVARKHIAAGEEITISYLDDDEKSRDERQDALADYGFVCRCARCEEEFRQCRRG